MSWCVVPKKVGITFALGKTLLLLIGQSIEF